MKAITEMNREELLALEPGEVLRLLTADEVVHMATVLGAFWAYDYTAAEAGRPGLHAELKSKRHSDGFFVSRILLEPENILKIMAQQVVWKLEEIAGVGPPDWVAGIPDGATNLGKEVARIYGSQCAEMEKRDGRITLITPIPQGDSLLLVEDFCTRGTGFVEAVTDIKLQYPDTVVLPYDPVILNRGGLKEVSIPEEGAFEVVPVVERRIQDWEPGECLLCGTFHSQAIKPKVDEESWRRINTAQK